MRSSILHPPASELFALAARQHGVVSRAQLLAIGLTQRAVRHRVASGRLHPVQRGVYGVGRPDLTEHGRWMAALLACGPEAALSHGSAGALWGLAAHTGTIVVSVPARLARRRPGVVVHRRAAIETTDRDGIRVTTPAWTLVDLATTLDRDRLERAVNEADARSLITAERLRAHVDHLRTPGAGRLRALLDRRTFALTDSALERRFLPLTRRAGLPRPRTQDHVDGFRVDFHWPELGLVVETDGLRYHRTAAQQARDRLRDQAHAAAGRTTLRFTHAQVRYEPDRVVATLGRVAARLRARG